TDPLRDSHVPNSSCQLTGFVPKPMNKNCIEWSAYGPSWAARQSDLSCQDTKVRVRVKPVIRIESHISFPKWVGWRSCPEPCAACIGSDCSQCSSDSKLAPH